MPLKDHLKARRAALHYTLEDVATLVGVTRQTVQKYESGLISNIPADKIALLAQALKTTPAELMGWQILPLDPLAVEGVLPIRSRQMPLLCGVKKGRPVFAKKKYSGPALLEGGPACDFALRVEGDSMAPCLKNGDTVFLRKQDAVQDGQIAALIVEGGILLRRVYAMGEGQGMQLISENPRCLPLVYTGAEAAGVRIVGRAVGYHRCLL